MHSTHLGDNAGDDLKVSIMKVEDISTEENQTENAVAVYRSWSQEHRDEVERKLLRKIDRRILPLLVLIYIMNYMDRTSVTQARLYGIEEDLGITGAVWQTGISILSVSYIITQVPATLLMSKWRPSILLPTCMILWAIVSACTGATTNITGFLTVRFCLGITEGPFFPSAIYYLSCWYRKRELGVRIALLMSGLVSSQAFAGLISAGILKGMTGVTKLAAWRWLFIFEGGFTICIGVIALFVLPDYPSTTKWLTTEEKICGTCRLAEDVGSEDILDEEKVPIMTGLLAAAKDYRVWLFACLQMSNTACISFSSFFPTLIHELGFHNNTTVLLISSPPYVLGFFSVVSLSYYADWVQIRSIPGAISMATALAAAIMILALRDTAQWARYAMLFPLVCGIYSTYCVTYTWLSSTIVRPPVKRAAAIGICNTCANCAVLFGNYFWLGKYAPTYAGSWGCIVAFASLSIGCTLALRWSLSRENKRLDRVVVEVGETTPGQIARLSEVEQRAVLKGFRYVI